MRAVQAGPVSGLIAQVALLAALAGTVGLGGAGWVVGIACGLLTSGALSRGLSRYRVERLGPADWVTLVRATLVVGVAALTAVSFGAAARRSRCWWPRGRCSRRSTRSTAGWRDVRARRLRWARASTARSTRS